MKRTYEQYALAFVTITVKEIDTCKTSATGQNDKLSKFIETQDIIIKQRSDNAHIDFIRDESKDILRSLDSYEDLLGIDEFFEWVFDNDCLMRDNFILECFISDNENPKKV